MQQCEILLGKKKKNWLLKSITGTEKQFLCLTLFKKKEKKKCLRKHPTCHTTWHSSKNEKVIETRGYREACPRYSVGWTSSRDALRSRGVVRFLVSDERPSEESCNYNLWKLTQGGLGWDAGGTALGWKRFFFF